MDYWGLMVVYTDVDYDNSSNLWNKDTLISIREYEKEAKANVLYSKSCLANQVVGGSILDVECD